MATSVVVLVVDAHNIAVVKGERESPIAADGNGPSALSRSVKLVQVQPREAHVAGRRGCAQATENQPKAVGMFRLNAGLVSCSEEPFQAFMPEGLDRHETIVTRNWSRYNPHDIALHPTAAADRVGAGG
jgi:hypothetical protein